MSPRIESTKLFISHIEDIDNMSQSKDRDIILALIVGIMLITVVVLGVLAFAPLDPFSSGEDWSYQGSVPLESLDLSIEADVCDVDVAFGDLDGDLVKVEMNIEGKSGYLVGEPDINYTVTSSLNAGKLSVVVVLDMNTGPTVTYDESDIVVTVDRSLPAFLAIEVDVGDVVITVPEGSYLMGAAVHADVGKLHLNLEDGAETGDLDLRSDVGSVKVECTNAIFAEGTLVKAETGTGSIHLDLDMSSSQNGNVTFECLANVGSVNLALMIAGDASAEITSQANVGEIKTDLVGFSGMDVHLLSDNHPDVWNVELFLEADVGSVYIDAEWGE